MFLIRYPKWAFRFGEIPEISVFQWKKNRRIFRLFRSALNFIVWFVRFEIFEWIQVPKMLPSNDVRLHSHCAKSCVLVHARFQYSNPVNWSMCVIFCSKMLDYLFPNEISIRNPKQLPRGNQPVLLIFRLVLYTWKTRKHFANVHYNVVFHFHLDSFAIEMWKVLFFSNTFEEWFRGGVFIASRIGI